MLCVCVCVGVFVSLARLPCGVGWRPRPWDAPPPSPPPPPQVAACPGIERLMLAAEGGHRHRLAAFLDLNPAEGGRDDEAPPLSHVLAQVGVKV